MKQFLTLIAAVALYLAVGRGMIALFAWRTGQLQSRKALRESFGGQVAETTSSARRLEADAFSYILWVGLVALWPLFFVGQAIGLAARGRNRSSELSRSGWTIGVDPKNHRQD